MSRVNQTGLRCTSRNTVSSRIAALMFLVAALALFAASPQVSAAGDAKAAGGAFPSVAEEWHTVTVDLGSSVLVRIYGKILTVETPSDIAVTMGKNLSFINAWIGDSKGNAVTMDATERYLVIEGTAANLTEAGDTAIHEITYTLSGVRHAQFTGDPVRLKTVTGTGDPESSSGGCGVGFGIASLVSFLALSALRRK